MKKLLFFSILLLLKVYSFSQEVKNVVAVFYGEKISISYDLTEDKPNTTFDVNVKCFDFYNKEVAMYNKSGDIGSGIKAGKNKNILWYIQKDVRKINTDLHFLKCKFFLSVFIKIR